MDVFVLGVAGGSGSGKSTLVQQLLASEIGTCLAQLPHDAYYRQYNDLPFEERESINWDHPDVLETPLFLQHLDDLRQGHDIEQPIYDYETHSRKVEARKVPARPIVLVDGILLLAIPEVRERLDLAIFVDTPAEERIVRRMLRDVKERGRTLESVAKQFRETVRPMHDLYVQPSRCHAHVIVPWDWQTDVQPVLDLLLARLQKHLQTHGSGDQLPLP